MMDLKVNVLSIKRLRNSELVGFGKCMIAMMDDVYGDEPCVYADGFKKAYDEMEQVVSINTDARITLDVYDASNDDVWMGLNYFLKALMLYCDASIRDAATVVWNEFSKIPNPTRLPYDEEMAKLRSLLERLEAIPAETRANAHVDKWISMLRISLNAYDDASRRQVEAETKRKVGAIKQVRNALIDAYLEMVEKINATQLLALDGKLNILIPKMNELVDKTQERLEIRKQNGITLEPEPDIVFN